MSEQKLSFQAEVSQLLDIVANSLYSNKEIFLRELISNASDACDRLRYAALTQPDLTGDDAEYKIALACDAKTRRVIVSDNGIGMNREELVENLGTIAHSGTAAFVHQLEDKPEGVNLIGRFGVGFYSAFMVAETVEVLSRKAGEAEGWRWASDGHGEFTISESEDAPARGTRITLELKKGQEEFLDPLRLERIVRTYSDHIAVPVVLAKDGVEETLNAASALWTRPKSEISDEQYKEFYHHVAHAFDEPWLRLHFKAEGVIEYTGLLYVPSTKPFDLFQPERKHGVKLYVKRVFITDDCEGLVPPYLRFLRGIVDSEDLPLNINRETLQSNPVLAKIGNAVTKRTLNELKKKAKKAPEEYATFWSNFGGVLKEGLYEDEGRRETLFELVRFPSTRGGDGTSLADYLGRMPEGQDAIYYISGEDTESLRESPQLEGFAAKGVEVLFMTDPVDEFWLPAIAEYQGKPFKSVTRGGADLAKIADRAEAPAEADQADQAEAAPGIDTLVAFVKLALKDQVKDVRASERLTDSPVCLVADEGDMDMHLERLLKQHHQIDQTSRRILEINPRHALIRRLVAELETRGTAAPDAVDGEAPPLEEAARLLLDQARILEGEPLPDPSAFARRLSRLVARGFGPES
ncbi:MAG: molecular chaperone HtpG [Proteobacteria bacterium]|nr:molecular chaperone HtpG [Pseudomonadota bacterium]